MAESIDTFISRSGTLTFDDLVNSVTAEDYATMSSLSAKVQFDQDAFVQFSSVSVVKNRPISRASLSTIPLPQCFEGTSRPFHTYSELLSQRHMSARKSAQVVLPSARHSSNITRA